MSDYSKTHRERLREIGRQSYQKCKVKRFEYAAKWKKANREKIRLYARASEQRHPLTRLQRKLKHYGIGLDEYNNLLEKQGGLCAICGEPPIEPKRLNVDHEHETGRVRGLLCGHCNRALGHFRDNIGNIVKAGEYLKAHLI